MKHADMTIKFNPPQMAVELLVALAAFLLISYTLRGHRGAFLIAITAAILAVVLIQGVWPS